MGRGERVNQYPRDFGLRRSCECREDHTRVDLWPELVRELTYVRERPEELLCKPDGVVLSYS